jgi:type II secretory pathway pseudopilin PulG
MRYRLNQNGITYLMVLMLVMVMGIMAGMIGQSWKMIMQREREKELIFRGSQIKEAIENWYNPNYPGPGTRALSPLNKLEDLLEAPGSLTKIRFLRRPYTDPMMPDKKWPDCWTQIRGPLPTAARAGTTAPATPAGTPPSAATGAATTTGATMGQGIIGVASTSKETTIRVAFSEYSSLRKLADKKSDQSDPDYPERKVQYRDWQFVYDPANANDHSKTYNSYHERW